MITVSVVIPVYNDEEYLEECLDSVLSQTLDSIEIICINDGSTDNTINILNKYQEKNTNLIVINQENKGVGNARNRGIQIATGEYIAFMDADDYYPSVDVLEYLYSKAKEKNVKICGGSYIQNRNGIIVKEFAGDLSKVVFFKDEKMDFFKYAFPFGFYRFIYNREFIVNNDIKFPECAYWEDPLFLIRAMINADKFYAVKKETYVHRVSIHKKKFPYNTVMGMLKSYKEAMKLASFTQNKELQKICTKHVLIDQFSSICKQCIEHEDEIIKELEECYLFVLEELIKEQPELIFYFEKQKIEQCIYEIKKEIEEISDTLDKYEQIIIYGAGLIAKHFEKGFREKLNCKLLGYAVTNKKGNADNLNGVSVYELDECIRYKNTALFLIAVNKTYRGEIRENLINKGIKHIYSLDYEKIKAFIEE